jgi:diguanylate cyclase (GGDEF)-like protein
MGGIPVPASAMRGGWLRSRSPVTLAFFALAILLSAYFVYVFSGADDGSLLVDGWAVAAFELAASGLCIARAVTRRRGRAFALALGLSLLMWSLGDVVLTIESLGGATAPVPSAADAFYLAFFPLAYVAIVLLMRGETRHLSSPSWLDGAIAGMGAAAVCAAFALHDLVHLTGGRPLEVAVNLAYPVGDLLLLFLIVAGTAILSGRRRAPWLLLAGGAAINVVGDTLALVGSSVGTAHLSSELDAVAWPTAILLMSIAVWLPQGRPDAHVTRKPPGYLLPALGGAGALLILAFAGLHEISRVAFALAIATLTLAGARLARTTTGLRELTQRRYRQSVTDHLTGLGNRRYLFELLDTHFADDADAEDQRTVALLYVDLDNFKELNDSFGHPAGDEVLNQVGARLRESLRRGDVLTRLGGDEFAVVLSDADVASAVDVAGRLAAGLREPFTLDAVKTHLSASIGIALGPADASDSAGLLWCADAAMYRAKAAGTAHALYEERKDFDHGANRMRIAEQLKSAIASDQLALHYQPQLALDSNTIANVEALCRWPHPTLGLVPPLTFLPIAEEAGLMHELTAWVLETALAQCAAWRAAGHALTVSVNVSATNMREPDFARFVGERLQASGLPATALVLELTETSIIQDFESARSAIAALHEQGIVVSVDDFGAGFTSLAYLSGLAVGELKLDRSFIAGASIDAPERRDSLIRATIDLGHALELRVVAEGIEDESMLNRLAAFGCDLVQGYFIQAPRPAAELELARAETAPAPAAAERAARGRALARAPHRATLARRR